ncbi:MAG: imidazoleglycerol-phosphate dehydratase HisB [Anaerolineales bacterium]
MRKVEITRQTGETLISLELNLDGSGLTNISSGLGFLDHMLKNFAFHGLFDLQLHAQGDLEVDAHHTVEDIGITLGSAFDKGLGERRGIVRIGDCFVPMDEALAHVVLDFSGRPYTVLDIKWNTPYIGSIPTRLIDHFLESFAVYARCNLHAFVLYGKDDHHQAEALFKALGRAIHIATRIDPIRVNQIPSTKGVIN